MRKQLRTVALVLAHIGLVVCAAFLILMIVAKVALGVERIARIDFFVFDYFYLVIPLLALISGILIQIVVVQPKRRKKQAANRTKE